MPPVGGDAAWLAAARRGDCSALRDCLAKGVDVDETTEDGQSALHLAAAGGFLDAVRLLIEHCDADESDFQGNTPVWYALQNSHSLVLRLLASDGECDLGTANEGGSSLLHACNTVEDASFLLEQGAKVNALDGVRDTPLHAALRRGSLGVAQLLLEHGADAKAVGANANTPLHVLAASSHSNRLELVELLLEKGALADVRNKSSQRPVDLISGCSKEDDAVLNALLDAAE